MAECYRSSDLSRPNPAWTHVDELFTIGPHLPFRIDSELHISTIKNPVNGPHEEPSIIMGFPSMAGRSSPQADQSRLGRSAVVLQQCLCRSRGDRCFLSRKDALEEQGAVAITISTLSNRLHHNGLIRWMIDPLKK